MVKTAYIALHIGGMLEVQQTLRGKVLCVILYPNYYDLGNKMADGLADAFGKDLLIKGIATTEGEINSFGKIELIISIVRISNESTCDFLLLSPFLTERDISAVKRKLDYILWEKKRKRIENILRSISDASLFSRNVPLKNETEAIQFMARKLCEKQYVDDTFAENVLERELAYSTAYGVVAIPHSMKMCASETKMYIVINEKPVEWGDGKVSIILLFSISQDDRAKFYEVFDNLIVLLLEPQNARLIMDCKTYEEFVKTIIGCY